MTATKQKQTERAEAITQLRKWLKPGDTVYTVLRYVSKSGMKRGIDLYIIMDGRPQWITAFVGKAIDQPQTRRDWEQSRGLGVTGCGMDMGFGLVYDLSRNLFHDDFECIGERCPSNDHSNGDRNRKPHKHSDGGYALRHEWI